MSTQVQINRRVTIFSLVVVLVGLLLWARCTEPVVDRGSPAMGEAGP